MTKSAFDKIAAGLADVDRFLGGEAPSRAFLRVLDREPEAVFRALGKPARRPAPERKRA